MNELFRAVIDYHNGSKVILRKTYRTAAHAKNAATNFVSASHWRHREGIKETYAERTSVEWERVEK